MEKNALIAIVLSILVLLGSQYYQMKNEPPEPLEEPVQQWAEPLQKQAPADFPAPSGPLNTPAPMPGTPVEQSALATRLDEKLITVMTNLYMAELSTIGGTIKSFTLHNYTTDEGDPLQLLTENSEPRALAIGFNQDFSASEVNFKASKQNITLVGDNDSATLVMSYTTSRYSIKRTFTFYSDSYKIDLRDEVSGLPAYQITLGPNLGLEEGGSTKYSHIGPVVLEEANREEMKHKKLKKTEVFTGIIKWVANEDKYFTAAIAPKQRMLNATIWNHKGDSVPALTGQGASGTFEHAVYIGPKLSEALEDAGHSLKHIIDYGFFSIIARPIFWLLQKIHSFVGNYGWAIILLTITIRIPFIPLVSKGQKAMKKMQMLQPKVKALQAKYKNNKQQLQTEMMALYKKHKANPMSGCLPMLAQLPVFFALYKVLLISIELKGAPWILWITDLSTKDPYYVLPILMGVSMFVQQKMTPTSIDPKQQKIMMFMPVIFTFLFLSFASGLVLYWLVNNLLSITQQFFVNKKAMREASTKASSDQT